MSAVKYAETVLIQEINNVMMEILLIMMDVILSVELKNAGFVKEIRNVDMTNRTLEYKLLR